MFVYQYTCAIMCMGGRRTACRGSSLLPFGPWDQNKVVRLGGKCPPSLSPLFDSASPIIPNGSLKFSLLKLELQPPFKISSFSLQKLT